MKVKHILWAFPLVAVGIMAGAKASVVDETTVQSSVGLGKVSIVISETKPDSTGTGTDNPTEPGVTGAPPDVICPGEIFSNIKKISNTGEDCWVRLVLTNYGDIEVTDDFFYNFDTDKWRKKDLGDGTVHYYLTEKLLSDSEPLVIFDGITIPSSWDNNQSGKEISYELVVEAVQANNFTPDFNSDEPWGEITVVPYQTEITS